MKRYMHGELAPDVAKRPNDKLEINPNMKINKVIWLVMVKIKKENLNQK